MDDEIANEIIMETLEKQEKNVAQRIKIQNQYYEE